MDKVTNFPYMVLHQRGACAERYKWLKDNIASNAYNNTDTLLVTVRHSGNLSDDDRSCNELTWLENSASHLGVTFETFYSNKSSTEFAYTDKIEVLAANLDNTKFKYWLYADSLDSVLIRNPDECSQLLSLNDCDILFSSTAFPDWDSFTMPQKQLFNSKHFPGAFLNAGVFVGKVSALRELFNKVLESAAYLPCVSYNNNFRLENGYLLWSTKELEAFPKGVSDDQTIIRYLIEEFWPRIKVDTVGSLARPRWSRET